MKEELLAEDEQSTCQIYDEMHNVSVGSANCVIYCHYHRIKDTRDEWIDINRHASGTTSRSG